MGALLRMTMVSGEAAWPVDCRFLIALFTGVCCGLGTFALVFACLLAATGTALDLGVLRAALAAISDHRVLRTWGGEER